MLVCTLRERSMLTHAYAYHNLLLSIDICDSIEIWLISSGFLLIVLTSDATKFSSHEIDNVFQD